MEDTNTEAVDSIDKSTIVKNLFHPAYESNTESNEVQHSSTVESMSDSFQYMDKEGDDEEQTLEQEDPIHVDTSTSNHEHVNSSMAMNITQENVDHHDIPQLDEKEIQEPQHLQNVEQIQQEEEEVEKTGNDSALPNINQAQPSLEEQGLVTPQKDLLSPPPVTRKITDSQGRQRDSLSQYASMRSGRGRAVSNSESRRLRMHLFQNSPMVKDLDKKDEKYNEESDLNIAGDGDDAGETSSLVSEYGSEIGEVKLRLDDVQAMEALEEEQDDSHEEEEELKNEQKIDFEDEKEITQEESHSNSNLRSTDEDLEKEASNATGYEKQKPVTINDDSSDVASQDEDGSVDSVDLSSTFEPVQPVTKSPDPDDFNSHSLHQNLPKVPVGSPRRCSNKPDNAQEDDDICPLSPHVGSFGDDSKHKDEQGEPTTPIAAVSKALKHIRNGVNPFVRCTKTPPQMSPSTMNLSDAVNFQYRDNGALSGDHWLSPRFGNQKNFVSKSAIQQPLIAASDAVTKSPSWRNERYEKYKVKGTNAIRGITSCLSYDDQAGSPPSSPLPQHRRPWGSTGSELLSSDVGEFLGSIAVDFDENESQRKVSSSTPYKSRSQTSTPNHLTSPKPTTSASRSLLILQSPKRAKDIDKEDALDLLALFVDRTRTFNEKLKAEYRATIQSTFDDNIKDLKSTLATFLENTDDKKEEQMKTLEALEDAYTYAMEMRQASRSASMWLDSIDRTDQQLQSSDVSQIVPDERLMQMNVEELRDIVRGAHFQLLEQNEINTRLSNELSLHKAELIKMRTLENSLLAQNKSILDDEENDIDESSESSSEISHNEFPSNTSDIKIDIKEDLNKSDDRTLSDQLNSTSLDVANARKEIVILKAELEMANRELQQLKSSRVGKKERAEALEVEDESDDLRINEKSDQIQNDESGRRPMVTDEDPSSSFLMEGLKEELDNYVAAICQVDKEEISILKRRLEELESQKEDMNQTGESMVSVQLQNDENYSSEWESLGNLPPPPDHDLRSPIVSDLLKQWTQDSKTQDSLLEWVENVLKGQNPADVPPLQLSGLDHQVKDGFAMHLLPFLLKRSDIQVEVNVRMHRKSSYDISVRVDRASSVAGIVDSTSVASGVNKNLSDLIFKAKSPHMMAFKASSTNTPVDNSLEETEAQPLKGFRRFLSSPSSEVGSATHSTVTATTSNRSPAAIDNNRKTIVEEEPIKAESGNIGNQPQDQTPRQESRFSGAFNAMGGLLSRRKTPNTGESKQSGLFSFSSPSPTQVQEKEEDLHETIISQESEGEDDQPFHRVVSCPPGRIGITFVQYRGHAMISDVSKESPLAGYVFPSDVVVAIDEVPVSGMRVPDIVKLLTTRKDRQRALRVISSHAMVELLVTPKSNALME
ncbi:hypothetical protein CTEN210_09371 [Chaetoceros tenuissimus]|uniref:PDZ domain-containing protein n=1 Tax=Chaetoceros tenuissimus TaxID=426638 RepID=A0AAD3H759_9STRA|nr:hypothetical protein CTEN210_09371 [Chaetoceros tenuissimus]